MTITEKISNYFDKQVAEGKLRPGDRLPKYEDICQQFNIPYSSAQRAFKNMEHEGKIIIQNGIGSFLNGGDDLDVDFFVTGTSFDLPEFQMLLDEISRKNDLHLKIKVKDIKGNDFQTNVQEHKVVITETDSWMKMSGCLLDYSGFDDYSEFMRQFRDVPNLRNSNLQLPFFLFTYQGAINPKRLKELSFKNRISSFSTLDWWEELLSRCKERGIIPSCKSIRPDELWSFPMFDLAVLLMLQERENVDSVFRIPFFTTPTGLRMFQILREFKSAKSGDLYFLQGESVFEVNIGSWVTVQHQRNFGCSDENFRIVPRMAGTRRILRVTPIALQTFVNPSVSTNEKKRIWMLLKELLSRKYQKKIVAMTGAISPRADMKPSDHAWFYREDFGHFFPRKDDITYSESMLSNELMSVLSTLYEQYEVYGADLDLIRKCMDIKLTHAYPREPGSE